MEISARLAAVVVGLLGFGCTPAAGSPVAPPDAVATEQPVTADEPSPDAVGSDDRDELGPPAIARDPQPRPNPYIAPPIRTAGDLTVHAPPRERPDPFVGRLRSHIDGGLSKGSPRTWVGPQVPGFVPLMHDTMELFLLDRVGDEFLAFYREPYGAGSCDTGGVTNCRYFARLYDLEGNELWAVALDELLSATTQLEIQDVRYADGTLYFNEACQSYSSGAKGKCSALVAYDPQSRELRWRTKDLVSNGRFLIHGDYIISGYGFTGEKDYVFVVSRADGSIVQRVPLPKSAETFVIAEDGRLEVTIYPGTLELFELRGWDAGRPSLVKAKRGRSGRQTVTR